MDIHLIRHPKTVAPRGTCYGKLDLEAAPDALEEAATRLAPQIPEDARIISSPQIRALSLAERLGPVEASDARLMEMNFGAWEGLAWDDIPRSEIEAWDADLAGYAPPGGESLNAVSKRVIEWWDSVIEPLSAPKAYPHMRAKQDDTRRPLAVVTHGGPLRLIAAHILGAPIEASMRLDIFWGQRALVRCTEHGVQITGWNLR